MLTKQEIFDKVRAHLLAQGAKSQDGAGECRYRAKDGLKCALGCLITDDAYDPKIEGDAPVVEAERTNAREKRLISVLERSGIPTDDDAIDFLRALQGIHDDSEPYQWPAKLTLLAVDQGLSAIRNDEAEQERGNP